MNHLKIVKFKPPPALSQEGTPLPVVQEDVWTPQAVMIFWRRKDILTRTDTRSHHLPARNVVAMPNTLLRMEYIN